MTEVIAPASLGASSPLAQPVEPVSEVSAIPMATPRLPAWSSQDLAGARPYALPTPGTLYRRVATRTPIPTPTMAPPATPQSLAAPESPPDAPAPTPLPQVAGGALVLVGAAAARQAWRRRIHGRPAAAQPERPSPAAPALDDELPPP